jgi:predicted permease
MAFVDFGQLSSLFFFVLYPFSAGISVANLVNSNVASSAVLVASVAMIGYMVLAGVAGRWILGTVKQVSLGAGVRIARVAARDFSVKLRGPVFGYIVKDLRVCSRNPATAFFFALPVLETLIVSLLIAGFQVLRVSAVLVASSTGGIFALLMPLALLNAEGAGLEYTKTLPVSTNRIMVAKALVSTATFVPVPLTVLALSFAKQLTSPFAILLPFFIMLAIASASIFEIKLFLCSAAKGRIAAVIRDAEKLAAGALITMIPVIAYAGAYFVSFDHVTAVLAMGGAAVSELVVALYVLRCS